MNKIGIPLELPWQIKTLIKIKGGNMGKIDPGDTAWLLTSAALVLLMTPGLALFYGGMVRAKNVLGTIMHSFFIMAFVGVDGFKNSWIISWFL